MSLNTAEAAEERGRKEMERYQMERVAGQGTFGTVQLGKEKSTGINVAIKKVIQDPRFRNRELQIMQELAVLRHPNIVQLYSYFYTLGEHNRQDVYLNVVMEYVPDTLHRCCRNFYRRNATPPPILIKVFLYQLIRSIGCLHLPSVNVCHRDIKPHNVLVNEADGTLKLCDFGSAKKLSPSEPNVAYICSRYYRAPELIFGNQHYTTSVDIWSVGCIFAEMMLGGPIFRGDNSASQLHEIVRVLGSPSREVMRKLNPLHTFADLYNRRGIPWSEVFSNGLPPNDAVEAYDLLSGLLQYLPDERTKPYEALCHPFFDELHKSTTKLPNNKNLPPHLFAFLPPEIECMTDKQRAKLLHR
ncbi:hypothetical protein JKF63_06511 [Porcisia hertigi]|uniref:Protein kinase domain-containing protein n=1 Tax=Porcisia hertigi TaxID=2761500 RepID=A0A836LEI7_9TRYP|nr:hypothetical protein JKF63_06511 [Porcisia hertigi]